MRWYCRYGISYRDLENMMKERGVDVDHTTLYRWVQCYAPEMTAYATIKGFETMRALRKKQASAFQFQLGIQGEVRLIERAFDLGDSALAEAVHILDDYLQKQAA